jgi:DNA repair protein RecN (Recombination protein N)
MLAELSIHNFAIIDELHVRFADGLNIISGETGAGKSILIGAVGLILGERANADMIRSHEDEAVVEALFDVSGCEAIRGLANEMGLGKGDEIAIRRTLSRSGKNRLYINGRMAALSSLSIIGESLINICSQNSHQMILNPESQTDILDEFGGLLSLRAEYREMYDSYRRDQEKLCELRERQTKRAEKEDLQRYQIEEIIQVNPAVGEDAALVEERNVLTNMEKLSDLVQSAYETLYEKGDSVLSDLHGVVSKVKEVKRIDPAMPLSDREVEDLYYRIEDAALTLRDYGKGLVFDPVRLEAVETRLELLGRLKRKYGGSVESVLEKLDALKREMEDGSTLEAEINELTQTVIVKRKRLLEKAEFLSGRRRLAASDLKRSLEREIQELRMENARFEVVFHALSGKNQDADLNEKGKDSVEFYLSANKGEELKPLRMVASGGELSRIILAFKKVLAMTGSVATIVFDEVDSGIGGATAEVVGKKLQEVSNSHQVICITHLAQIACRAASHLLVSKHTEQKRTIAKVSLLDDEGRLEEIARMLGGVQLTEKTREHAREMLLAARQ